jgi:hypothetical protein
LDHKTARQKQYLAKAHDAEQSAAKARNEAARADWIRIAQKYRELAHIGGSAITRA